MACKQAYLMTQGLCDLNASWTERKQKGAPGSRDNNFLGDYKFNWGKSKSNLALNFFSFKMNFVTYKLKLFFYQKDRKAWGNGWEILIWNLFPRELQAIVWKEYTKKFVPSSLCLIFMGSPIIMLHPLRFVFQCIKVHFFQALIQDTLKLVKYSSAFNGFGSRPLLFS